MKLLIVIPLLSALLAGCAAVEHTSKTEQPIGEKRIVGVGDVILKVNKQRSLENVFGKSDIFGRKTNEGFSELRFAGVEPSGEIVLYRKDVLIHTNETTMSRTPFTTSTAIANTNLSGNYYQYGNTGRLSGNAQTTYTSTTMSPTSDYHVVVPSETIPIRIPKGESKVPMAGYIVEIIRATSSSLEYQVINQN